ncbi:unnamed protein product [Ixodes pacificus]
MLWEECRSRPSVAQGTHVEPRAFRFQALLGVLPQPPSLLLGLELADWKGKGALVARRMAPLLELANLVVLQTHFTRHWRFCRAAHVSLYAPPTSDACPQSTPALTALEWMSRLEPSSTPVCLSFNMAAVEFRGLAYPSAGSPCETSREIAPVGRVASRSGSTACPLSIAHRFSALRRLRLAERPRLERFPHSSRVQRRRLDFPGNGCAASGKGSDGISTASQAVRGRFQRGHGQPRF